VKDLRGRVALVTGGAAGIGLGIARVLAQEGAHVAIADLDGGAAERAAGELRRDDRETLALQFDVVDRRAVEEAVATVLAKLGRIDILAANAGIYRWDPLDDLPDEIWDRIMDVNVKGALHAVQACLPAMRRQGYGRIVFTSSITGPLVATSAQAHYAASKSAMLGLMRSAAIDLARAGITVNAVQPGNVRTPGLDAMDEGVRTRMLEAIPLGRLAEPEEVGWAVRFLASEEAGYVTGQTLVVDGGQVLPELPS
jgi:3-oxoacyl-[acyl-carrier protein] reductase